MKKSGSLYEYELVLLFILKNYGYKEFTTEEIYTSATLIGIPENSVGSTLNRLKRDKHILDSKNPRYTVNDRIMLTWWVVPSYSVTKGIRDLSGNN